MAFICHISESGKSFIFKGLMYKTPCRVPIITLIDNQKLKKTLSDKNITNFKVKPSKNKYRQSRKIELGTGDGTVSLQSSIKN